jgi:hypothetical protein
MLIQVNDANKCSQHNKVYYLTDLMTFLVESSIYLNTNNNSNNNNDQKIENFVFLANRININESW